MATVTDFLAHAPENEFFAFWGDGATGYYGATFVAQASDLTQIEFDIDPAWGRAPDRRTIRCWWRR